MNNKSIAKLLRKAVKESEYQSHRLGKMNGFEVIVEEETKICPHKLSAKISMLADMLEESHTQKEIKTYDGENARFG